MKLKLITASLLLAALPLAAQADPATERALELNQAPLSTASAPQDTATAGASLETRTDWGGSEAMAQARLRLDSRAPETHIATAGDATRLGRLATQG